LFPLLSVLLLLGIGFSRQSGEKEDSPKIEVKELKQMHQSIYPMWHKAYPSKDTTMLKELYPRLVEHFEKVKAADFPSGKPDRLARWNEEIQKVGEVLDRYLAGMQAHDQEQMLSAARDLHTHYENLHKITNPPLPEVEAFHSVLYYVYHDYLPGEDWRKINDSIDEFQQKMAALKAAELPEWMKRKENAFREAAGELDREVEKLADLKGSENHEAIANAIEDLHSAYVNLEHSLE
ncbi:MAG: hypothetical protein WAN36_06320, partial [Calditrichia bacterium]